MFNILINPIIFLIKKKENNKGENVANQQKSIYIEGNNASENAQLEKWVKKSKEKSISTSEGDTLKRTKFIKDPKI